MTANEPLTPAGLGLVLSAMAKELHYRITTTATGPANQVLWPLHMTLRAGIEECLKLAKEDEGEGQHND